VTFGGVGLKDDRLGHLSDWAFLGSSSPRYYECANKIEVDCDDHV
jgi:hypothetical protein